MYKRTKNELTNEIHKENEIRKVLNCLVPKVLEELRPFVGEKILLKGGGTVKKFSEKIKFLQEYRDKAIIKPLEGMNHASLQRVYIQTTDYSIRLEVSASFQDSEHTCCYHKGTFYIGEVKNDIMGNVDNGKLEKVNEWEAMPMLSVAQEWKKYEIAFKAAEKAEKAIDRMYYSFQKWLR